MNKNNKNVPDIIYTVIDDVTNLHCAYDIDWKNETILLKFKCDGLTEDLRILDTNEKRAKFDDDILEKYLMKCVLADNEQMIEDEKKNIIDI